MSDPAAGAPRRGGTPAGRRLALVLAGALALWLAAGVRQLDPTTEIGVLEGPVPRLFPLRVARGLVLAPPLLTRLVRYPRGTVEVPLPAAREAWLPGPDGSRYGLRGTALLQVDPRQWRRFHEASGGRGLRGVLLEAVRASGLPRSAASPRKPPTPATVREMRDSLGTALEARGVKLQGIRVESFDALTVEAGRRPPAAPTRLLVLGLDGADWQIVDPLLAKGRLPNLAALIHDGVRAKLLSIHPTLSPVVWTTVATGVEPSRHGILDFVVPDPAGGPGEPVTSAQRRVATVWQMLSRAGIDVGVVAWWATWPAEPVHGYLVSDRVAYQLFDYRSGSGAREGKVWPPELYDVIRPHIVEPDSVPWSEVRGYLDGARTEPGEFNAEESELLRQFRTVLASGRTYFDIASDLERRLPPAFEAVYFEGTDTVAHLFMPYRAPRMAGVDRRRYDSFHDVVDRYYETMDGYLGHLLEDHGKDWTILILSDHGFVTGAERPRTTDSRIGHGAAADWHRRFGILILSGRHVRAGATIDEATVYDIAPTILALFGQPVPASWPGKVLAGALEREFLEAHPVEYRDDEPARGELLAAGAGGGQRDPAGQDLREKLESLGYLGATAQGSPAPTPTLTNRNNAGVAYMAEGRYAKAEAEFRAGLEEQPDHAPLLLNLGMVLAIQGREDEARERFLAALKSPETRRSAGHQLAQMCLAKGDLAGAERYLRQVLAVEPDAPEIRTTLGLVLEQRGHAAEAEAEYRKAARLDPNSAIARNNLGNLANRAGRVDEAERWYQEAIAADPYFMGAYNNLALVYQERGEIQKAIDLYTRARSKAPDNAVVLNNLGSLRYATGDRDRARRLWQQAATADPAYPSPVNNLAGLAIAEGRYDEAERLLRRALELKSDYGDARINLALVHRARGETDAARHELERATGDPAARSRALTQLGLLDLEQGDPASAVKRLLEAGGLEGGNAALLNGLGEAYRRLGRSREAAQAWRRSLKLDPSQEQVRQSLAMLDLD